MRIDLRTTPLMWRLAEILLLFPYTIINQGIGSSSVTIQVFLVLGVFLSWFILMILPILSTLADFLVYLPRSIHDDVMTTTMEGIFIAPVSTRSIVKDLRTWAVRLNISHLLPSVALLAGFLAAVWLEWIRPGAPQSSEDIWTMAIDISSIVILLHLLWGFFLGTGLAAAGLPWKASSSGLIIMCWILPVLVAVFWGGAELARLNWFYAEDFFSSAYQYEMPWYCMHFVILLSIPTWSVHRHVQWLMEQRRTARWS